MAHDQLILKPEASSTMQALAGVHYSYARLYTLLIKIGTRATSSHELSQC